MSGSKDWMAVRKGDEQVSIMREDLVASLLSLADRLLGTSEADAIAVLQAIELIDEGNFESNNKLAHIYYKNGDLKSAIKYFEDAVSKKDNSYDLLFYLANAYKGLGEFSQAIDLYKRSLQLHSYPEACINLAAAYGDSNDPVMELHTLEDLTQTFNDYALGHYNLGICHYGRREIDKAIQSYRQALAISPNDGSVKLGLATALLMNKQYSEGFAAYESRFGVVANCPVRNLHRALWSGDSVKQGSSILVTHEQGFGDQLQMLRYVPELLKQFQSVCVEVQPEMVRLVSAAFPATKVIAVMSDVPHTDYYCPTMSLPKAFGTTYQTIPVYRDGYIVIPSAPFSGQQLPISKKIKVGICWRGGRLNPKMMHRSMRLQAIQDLFDDDKYTWVSLTKDVEPDEKLAIAERYPNVIDVTDQLTDFYDTYFLIKELDLVVTVDTAIAHLAGAMGKDAIVLLNEGFDWRWHINDEVSAWYPTLRLLRTYQLESCTTMPAAIFSKIDSLMH